MQFHPLFTDEYLFSHWGNEFEAYVDQYDSQVLKILKEWGDRDTSHSETQLEGLFVQRFFRELWGYVGTGEQQGEQEFSLYPQYPIPGAGQRGGTGKADLALGLFRRNDIPDVPQSLCEFKDIKSALDAPQNRKGNTRSPVTQCLDYLKHSFDQTPVQSTLFPTWGIVTDMNEFRLYYRKVGSGQFLQFFVDKPKGKRPESPLLIGSSKESLERRFLFWKAFSRNNLLSEFGKSELEKLFDQQLVQERSLEKSFYLEYKAFRQFVYETIVEANPDFDGTKKELVRLTQRFLDRCVFLLFCEDMGNTLGFPTNLVRDILAAESKSTYFSSTGHNIWSLIRDLFAKMRDGGEFPPDHTINRFNGGLFERNSRLESLTIPNSVFCTAGQGASAASIDQSKNTLLYLSASYNFGAEGADRHKTITLYALGRIFEQSITELEYMEAEAEAAQNAIDAGKNQQEIEKAVKEAPSIAKLSSRKRNGVYYTPEWVTSYIVREVVGERLAEERKRLKLEIGQEFKPDALAKYRASLGKTSPRSNPVTKHIKSLDQYHDFLSEIKIVDPACGSGAFLIQALQFLLLQHEIVSAERKRIEGQESVLEQDQLIRDILTKNLYGVDLSPESVEITQLALWLNTARKDRPLSSLGHHIREGNSLIGPEFHRFYEDQHGSMFEQLDHDYQERVNVFDWQAAFPEVLGEEIPEEHRGFDCVIGNPPYVKLQNFRKIRPDESEYLLTHTSNSGVPVYQSTRTGNCDLYLPFIEKGLGLLNEKGRMGYIAPSVWLKNEYGQALRSQTKRNHQLQRWVDFGGFQIFDDVTVYTALQFFTKTENLAVHAASVDDRSVDGIIWGENSDEIPYSSLSETDAWNFTDVKSSVLLNKLSKSCDSLGSEDITTSIFQGIKTSADDIFVLERNENVFMRRAANDLTPIQLERSILRPIASPTDVKRYASLAENEFLIYPYRSTDGRMQLIPHYSLSKSYPLTWKYLQANEDALRARENRRFDTEEWFGFSRPQNLEKQLKPKLCVAGTATELRVAIDSQGAFSTLGGRVYSILPATDELFYFLLGILNSPVPNFVFKKIARPKANGYFEAERQFLAPLPVPKASVPDREKVANLAKALGEKTSERGTLIQKLSVRINSPNCTEQTLSENWLWADIKTPSELRVEAPARITAARERTAWAKDERNRRLAFHFEKLNSALRRGMKLVAVSDEDALHVKAGDQILLTKFGLAADESEYLAAVWSQTLRGINVTNKFKAEKLVKMLLRFRSTDDSGLRTTIVKLNAEIVDLDQQIEALEIELNQLTYRLYGLKPDEIRLVESSST